MIQQRIERSMENLQTLILDFDGVLTDNRVYVDEHGDEMVCCNRSDGLALGTLRNAGMKLFIVSSESNPVVTQRGRKLGIPVLQDIENKKECILNLVKSHGIDLERTLYIGNDMNDYDAMRLCKYSACPSDSHPEIIKIATLSFQKKGGEGVIQELVSHLSISLKS